jgi:RNA polymerase sigma-70 factor (ECF subfamily)
MSVTDNPSTVDLILLEEEHLRRVARRLVRCEADADDLVQETLLRAYRARDRFTPGTCIRAWTTTILRRVFLTNARRDHRRQVQTDTDAGELLQAVPDRPDDRVTASPSGVSVVAEHLDERVKRAIERIPATFGKPFWLAAMQDMSCAEIARLVEAPEGTVMSRIHRARERLRRDLAHYDGRPRRRAPVGRPARFSERTGAAERLRRRRFSARLVAGRNAAPSAA